MKKLIQFAKLEKHYKNNQVLKGIDFTIREGDRIALLGPNGAGKTTLIECLCQLRTITNGEIIYYNGRAQFLQNLGVQFQSGSYPIGIRVIDLIVFYSHIYKTKINKELYKRFQIQAVANHEFRELSFGQQKRVELFLILLSKVKFLILDEITAGMDIYIKFQVLKTIEDYLKDKSVTLIYVSHNLNEIKRLCNTIVFLKDGVLVEEKHDLDKFDLAQLMVKTYQWKI